MHRVYEYDKYTSSFDTVKSTLDNFGVAIIPDVINKDEIKEMNDGAWNYIEYASSKMEMPIYRDKPKSWRTYDEYFAEKSMLLQKYGVGHTQHLWNLRQNPKIVKVFETNYGTSDLATSFDGMSFGLPHEITKIKPSIEKWFHTDQNYSQNDFMAVQSWITGFDVRDGDATLGFLENSHKFHKSMKETFKLEENDEFYYEDYYEISKTQLDWYLNTAKCKEYYIKCSAGSMVLWDSRTIHYGASPFLDRKMSNYRNVAYICMQPREMISPNVKRKRIYAFNNLNTTSHWVTKCATFKDFPRGMPKETKDKILKPPIPVLTELGKSLI